MTDVGPCVSLIEKYAMHWCSMLNDPQGVFASCHSEISPDFYKEVNLTATALCFCGLNLQTFDMTSHCCFFILFPYRTACMTAVTARRVRTACVLQSPLTSMPVQQQESRSRTGGRPFVVSSEEQ